MKVTVKTDGGTLVFEDEGEHHTGLGHCHIYVADKVTVEYVDGSGQRVAKVVASMTIHSDIA